MSGFFFDKNSKTQGEKNSRRKKLKPKFGQKLNVPELLSPMWLHNQIWPFRGTQNSGVISQNSKTQRIFFNKSSNFLKTQGIFSKLKHFCRKLEDFGSKTQWTGAFEPSHVPNWSSKKSLFYTYHWIKI